MPFDASDALNHRLIFLEGNFANERKLALDAILVAAELHEDDAFDRESIVASEKPFAEWVSAASTTPFLAKRRCVIVRNVLRVDTDTAAESLKLEELKTLPQSALLILVADEEVRKDDDVSRAIPGASNWRNVVKKAGGLVLAFTLEQAKGGSNLAGIARSAGKKLTPRTQGLLLEMVANRPDRAAEELEKLILFVGDAPEITIEDVKRCVSSDPEHSVFLMLDSCWRGDAGRAMAQLQKLRSHTRDFHGEAIKTIGTIASQTRNLWQARGIVEDSPPGWELARNPISKMKDFPRRKAIENARRLSFDQILDCQRAIREASSRLTGQSLGVSSEEVMEQLILRLCQISGRRLGA